jgi:hypothetical protein
MTDTFFSAYALLIGVGESAYARLSLPATVKDIQALHKILIDPTLCGYPNDPQHIKLIHDQAATGSAIMDGLQWLQDQATTDPEATVIVYYSGHGWLEQARNEYYLLPHDIDPFDLAGSALAATKFTEALRQIQAKRLLVVIDSCHAAGMATSKDGQASVKLPSGFIQAAPPKGMIDALKEGKGRVVFTSSQGEESSWVMSDGSLSVYTHHLLEALKGAANKPGEPVVKVSNLMNHLANEVPKTVQAQYQTTQTPYFDFATEDFAIALLRGGKGLPAEGWKTTESEPLPSQPVHNQIQANNRGVAIGRDATSNVLNTGDIYFKGQ